MNNRTFIPYIPAPVDVDFIAQCVARSAAAVERSLALLSRLERSGNSDLGSYQAKPSSKQ